MAKRKEIKEVNLASSSNLDRLPGETETMELDGIRISVNEEKVESIQKELEEKVEEFRKKVYAVSMDTDAFNSFRNFINENSEWSSTEAIGIVEINKSLNKIEKEGIKDNMIYMSALTLEASHYFVSKSRGKGLEEAKNFLKLYKPLDISLNDVKEDNKKLEEIRTRLSAAQQGIEIG
jgi:hypothetical protein